MKKFLAIIALLALSTPANAAGLPAPQDVHDQLRQIFPKEVGAEMHPSPVMQLRSDGMRHTQFEVLFLSPDHPTSCLVNVETHRVSHCQYADGATGAPSPDPATPLPVAAPTPQVNTPTPQANTPVTLLRGADGTVQAKIPADLLKRLAAQPK